MTLVSLPHPARGMDAEEYLAQIAAMCALTGAAGILCDPAVAPLLAAAPVPVHPFAGWGAATLPAPAEASGRLVQFTSGSTGAPRGIDLSLDALDANLASMYAWLEPRDGAVVCSWLPLSHDMGLIGLALYAICSVNPPVVGPDRPRPHDPRVIPGRPRQLDAGLHRVPGHLHHVPALRPAPRLSGLAGSPRSSTSRRCAASWSGASRFPPTASASSRPSPGTMACPPMPSVPGTAWRRPRSPLPSTRPPWRGSRCVSTPMPWPSDSGERSTRAGWSSSRAVLRCRYRASALRVDTPVGVLEIRSPSLLERYVGAPIAPDGGRLATHHGPGLHVRDGEVYVAGRTDDVLIVAGRNLDARALDELVATHPACRPGNAACIPDGLGALRRRGRTPHGGDGPGGAPRRRQRDPRLAGEPVRREPFSRRLR